MASSTEFSGSALKVSLWFQPLPAGFGELVCSPAYAFSTCQYFTGHSEGKVLRCGSLCVRSSWRGRAARLVSYSSFIDRICINFLFVSSTHLSFARFLRLLTFCLFLSNRFLATNLVSLGLGFTLRHALVSVCLLFLSLACCYLFFVVTSFFV